VTGIVNALPKGGLTTWAANSVAEYAVTHMQAWEHLPHADAYDLLRRVPWQTRDRAAASGSEVHAVIERMVAGEDYTVEADIEPWIDAAKRFVEEVRPAPELTETTVYNERHLFAGSFDFLGRLWALPELGRCLVDYKTGKGVYQDMGCQVVGGYALGAEYYLDVADNEQEWRPPDSAVLVHLGPDGYQLRPVPLDRGFYRAFLAALEIRKWEKDGPKLGPALVVPARPDEEPGEEVWDLVYLRDQIAKLTTAQKLEASAHFKAEGIPTNPDRMTHTHIEQAIGLIKLYQMTEEEDQ